MSKQQSQEYRGNGEHEFERVTEDATSYTQRLRVPGGWLYHVTTDMSAPKFDRTPNFHVNTVFVPMPEVVKHQV